jgi:diguanylate cyclase (GGDEF)-like protein
MAQLRRQHGWSPSVVAGFENKSYMDSLLKHMVDITGHRDHAMLDVAVISAVHELAAAKQTRVLSLVADAAGPLIRQRACIAGSEATPSSTTPGDLPLAVLPSLAACLEKRAASASATSDDGDSILWMPIWIGDKADTILEIVRSDQFAADMVPMVVGIVGVYRNFQNLLDYSERDSLTGLLNRKTFDGQLSRMLQTGGAQALSAPEPQERANEAGQWLVVADIDFFKSVNDRFGHVYGDEVLILVANMLVSSFRADDRVFRFGGEEFVILLRSATSEQAHTIIERFRTNVAAHVFPQVGTVTVSLGYVQVRPGDSPVASLGHADQALYHAKTHGRNRTCHYDEIVATGQLQVAASNDTAEFF